MIPITVPPLGESITEATVSRWLKRAGEAIAAGETLVELETDKITVEVPAPKPGVLAQQAKAEGDVVAVGDTLGALDETVRADTATAPVAAPTAAAAPATGAAPAMAGAPVRSTPSARRLAEVEGVDVTSIAGTGRGGVVSRPDVVEAVAAKSALPAAAPPVAPSTGLSAPVRMPPAPAIAAGGAGARETREKMSTRRRRIAENLLQAQHSTAHLTTFNEIDMSAIAALRARMKEKVEREHGVKLSLMPFFAKATVMALKTFPVVNAQIDGDSIVYKHYVHLGIAVASDAGLVVPVIKDADRLGVLGLAREIATVATKARDGKLTIDDLTGGTFSITNGGVFGSLLSTPILNYPQVGILGLHKTEDRPVAVDGQVVIRPMMYVALSYDHRIVDGQQAVLFLVRLKELLEDPAAMLID